MNNAHITRKQLFTIPVFKIRSSLYSVTMNQTPHTKEQLLSIPTFKIGFASTLYCNYIDEFLANVNLGITWDVKDVLNKLISIAVENCGISIGERTVTFDMANDVLNAHPSLWNEEEQSENMASILDHWTEFTSEDLNVFLTYDITGMNIGEYFVLAMSMLLEYIPKDCIPAFSYATYIFFSKGFETGSEISQNDIQALRQAITVAEDDFRHNNEWKES